MRDEAGDNSLCILQASYQHNISDPPLVLLITQTHFGQDECVTKHITIHSDHVRDQHHNHNPLSVSLSLPRAYADTNASLTRKVFHLRVNKLIASSAVSLQCTAQLVPAPQESLPHVFEIVT